MKEVTENVSYTSKGLVVLGIKLLPCPPLPLMMLMLMCSQMDYVRIDH